MVRGAGAWTGCRGAMIREGRGCRDKIKTITHKSKRKVLVVALRITHKQWVLDEKSSFAMGRVLLNVIWRRLSNLRTRRMEWGSKRGEEDRGTRGGAVDGLILM